MSPVEARKRFEFRTQHRDVTHDLEPPIMAQIPDPVLVTIPISTLAVRRWRFLAEGCAVRAWMTDISLI